MTSNKMAQIGNNLKLNNAKSIACVRASALEWYRKNPQKLTHVIFHSILFFFLLLLTGYTSVTLQINNENRPVSPMYDILKLI